MDGPQTVDEPLGGWRGMPAGPSHPPAVTGRIRLLMRRTRITHIINSFEFGGAEAMLVNLLLRTDRMRYEPSVVSLMDDLSVARPIIDAGIPLAVMHLNRRLPNP